MDDYLVVRILFTTMSFKVFAALMLAAIARAGGAQSLSSRIAPEAGSELDRYLRALDVAGLDAPASWSLTDGAPRAFAARLPKTAHVWQGSVRATDSSRFIVLPARLGSVLNSGFPYGFNDGPLWAGRGVSFEASGGAAFVARPLTVVFRPEAFVTQNAAFPMSQGLSSVVAPYANGPFGTRIDLPQRFGGGVYGRVGLGDSYARLDAGPVAAGVSSESQIWGPAIEYPLILGNNAGGFPHAFVGTSGPLSAGPLRFSAKLLWGVLRQSGYSISDRKRTFATAGIGTIGFRGAPGLEVGAVRFFHTPYPSDGLLHAPFLKVFEGVLKNAFSTADNPSGDRPEDNQLASLFFRWAFAPASLELYGEYGREDHSWSLRDFFEEPDHEAGWMLGLQRVWTGEGRAPMRALRIEHLNTRIAPLYLSRGQPPWYVHGVLIDGHTERGQVLGAEGALGGGATTVAFDRYDARGRITIRWDRQLRGEALDASGVPVPTKTDVIHSIGIERTLLRQRLTLSYGARAMVDLNRDFQRDAFNLNLTASATVIR